MRLCVRVCVCVFECKCVCTRVFVASEKALCVCSTFCGTASEMLLFQHS